MNTRQRLAILLSLLLSSCTGQNPPIVPTGVENVATVVSSAVASFEPAPFPTATPQATETAQNNTPGPEQEVPPAPSSTLGVSASDSVSVGVGPALIPDTGQVTAATPTKKKADKYQDLTVPISGDTGFFYIPSTGFARGVRSFVRPQPADQQYSATDVELEIPGLGINIPIVGVPRTGKTWDVSWLGNEAGWLEGSAFPSWNGNSVLTGHFYMASGLPGPFVNLNKLKFGDQVVVHAYGQKYIFEVQSNTIVEPDDQSVMKHEEKSWLTLVTCSEYDENTATYKKRLVVRAVLVRVDWETTDSP